jgi:pimeloyl-ACP methyl ester carboxylesterase
MLYAKRYGSGSRVLVAYHGWGGDHRTFEPIVSLLPSDTTLISVDLPGYGQSAPPSAWTINSLTDALVENIGQLRVSRFTLLGNCSGAILALLVAHRIEVQVERLVLIDPFAFMPWYFSLFLNRRIGRKAYSLTFETSVGRSVTNMALRHRRTDETNLTRSFESVDHGVVYEYLGLLGTIDSVDRFQGLAVPVDIAYGEKTFAAVKKSLPEWKRALPQARSYELAGAGHLPIEEATRALADVLFMKTSSMPLTRNASR